MHKITLALMTFIFLGFINSVQAQDNSSSGGDYKFALGIRFSTAAPTLSNSVSIKYFMNDRDALEGLISFGTRFGIGGLWERHQLIGNIPAFTWFYGGGGYVGFQDH